MEEKSGIGSGRGCCRFLNKVIKGGFHWTGDILRKHLNGTDCAISKRSVSQIEETADTKALTQECVLHVGTAARIKLE